MKKLWEGIKEWTQRWAFIDAALLGGGLILSLVYFFYSNLLPERSPLRDLWLNISTDLLVVWLSVRIIDNRIKGREKRAGIRVMIGQNLNYLLKLAQDLRPKFYDWQIRDLKRETDWSAERFEKRKEYLDNDEREDVWTAISTAQTLVEPAQRFVNAQLKFEEVETDIRRSEFHYYDSKWFDDVSRLRGTLQTTATLSTEDVNGDLSDIMSAFQQEQSQVPQGLVPVVQSFFAAITDMVTLRIKIEVKIKELEEKVLKARNNIFAETEPD